MGLPARQIVERQAGAVRQAIGRLIEHGRPYALLDFPNHPNVGDSAIWLGEVAVLDNVAGRPPSYVCAWNTFDAEALRRALEDGVIFLHGGGNFGDIYPWCQEFRERVIGSFPDHRIVQLPQTIKFHDLERSKPTIRAVEAHKDFHLLVRDQTSMHFAQKRLGCAATMVPDSACWLEPELLRRRRTAAQYSVVMLMRSDAEAGAYDRALLSSVPSGRLTDWLEEPAETRATVRKQAVLRALSTGAWRHMARRRLFYQMLARRRFERGAAILASGTSVITDRLHGHIIAMLLDIPHVVLDNNYGKLSDYIHAWTKDYGQLQMATTSQEAIDKVAARPCLATA